MGNKSLNFRGRIHLAYCDVIPGKQMELKNGRNKRSKSFFSSFCMFDFPTRLKVYVLVYHSNLAGLPTTKCC